MIGLDFVDITVTPTKAGVSGFTRYRRATKIEFASHQSQGDSGFRRNGELI